MAVPWEGNAEWFVVSSGFIYFVRLMKSCVIYARSHCTIVYFDLGFLHFLEDTKTSISNLSNDLKSDLSRTGFFELLHLVFGLVFCSLWFLWVWGYWGRERGEVRCDFAQRLFLLPLPVVLSLPVPLNTIERVLLSDTPSPLLLSPGSLSDPTSTNI